MPLIYPPLPSWLKYNKEFKIIEGISSNDSNNNNNNYFDATNFFYVVAQGVNAPSRFSLTIYDEKTCDTNTETTAETATKNEKGKMKTKKSKKEKKQQHISPIKGLYMNLTVYF